VDVVRGTVLHCSRFGAVVRLDDGRLGLLPADASGMTTIRRASTGGRRPQFPFSVEEESGRRICLELVTDTSLADDERTAPARSSSSFEQKIIDYLRQTAERDPRAAAVESPRADERSRPDRLLPFEFRARRQYRDSPERPRRPKR
jgi:hypothetical protein